MGFSRFLKHVGSLIKLLRQFMSQKCFIEFSAIPTLKSPMKMKLSRGFAKLVNDTVQAFKVT